MRDRTRVVHAGLPRPAQGAPFLPGPVFAAPYHLAGEPDEAEYQYERFGNPTWDGYEAALGALEDADAVVLASGTAAMEAALFPFLRPGDTLVAPADAYPGVRALGEHLGERGIRVKLVDTDEEAIRRELHDATVVWVETPSNPELDVIDLRALARDAHAAGAWVICDNTLATALGQRPLDLGCDLVVTSAAKALTGHSDLVLGAVTSRDAGRLEKVRAWRGKGGGIPGPFEVWLAHRSLSTLGLRLDAACANAQALAEALAGRADVTTVRYPGLRGDPSHAVAARQMQRFGCVLSFVLADRETAQRFLAECRLVAEATSFGGVHSTAERRLRWCTDRVPEGFIRFSAGVEATEDLLADVLGALDRASGRLRAA